MTSVRRIAYITGTRADFGLMLSTLLSIAGEPGLALDVIATGMHLFPDYGNTIDEVRASGLNIAGIVPIEAGPPSGGLMARNVGRMLTGITEQLEASRPDVVLVLGDRGEMLAAATAALHLNIPVAHVHGGELSGTIDEPIRHAISKLSHLHFAATAGSRERLIRMGENPDNIHITGAPGLDGLVELASTDRSALFSASGLDETRPTAVLLYHPVVQETAIGAKTIGWMLDALEQSQLQVLALKPNSDAGGQEIGDVLDRRASSAGGPVVMKHVPRADFVSFVRHADVLIGNSSSGIIEAASFGTPVVNVGTRQNMRDRNDNVIDTPGASKAQIGEALNLALRQGRWPSVNIYGDGKAGQRIVGLLRDVDLHTLGAKVNAY
ncbi:UDP-N-acetyl glucosamine 2-epimerase [Devosia sp. Leaf420]|uniref:UDP-N-acetylglucosamine 2-epimerase n=1 Tax=Devosia sp. Leaf420 TaxID=1736374 RepID=UPI00071474B4|nr:UDP-N-acetylglucosamine 2-epimerase [Devosia sp. Leaf420]KQT41881.1 UDP-N-acetyl glucosamine 2-epimerase [Devosia sp. Leaf420]